MQRKKEHCLHRHKIKCGNSIIEDQDVDYKKAFEWRKEFPQVVTDGLFDVIVGNPPYVRHEELSSIKPYLESNYSVYASTADLYVYFLEKALKLLRNDGILCFIVSNKWLKTSYGSKVRKFLSEYWIESLIDFGDIQIFEGATTYPCIIFIKKLKQKNPKIKCCLIKTEKFQPFELFVKENQFFYDQNKLEPKGWNLVPSNENKLLEKIKKNSISLDEYINGKVYRGILTGLNKAFVIDEKTKNKLISEDKKSKEIIKPFLIGKDVQRYVINYQKQYIILTKIGVDIKKYPAIFNWLSKFESDLEKRWDKGNYWYELRTCNYYDLFEKPKIVYGDVVVGPRFTLDDSGSLTNQRAFFIPITDKKLLGILNSKLGWFFIKNLCTHLRGGYYLAWDYLKQAPIVQKKSPEIEKLVDEMISLNKQLGNFKEKITEEAKRIEEQIKRVDNEIDEAVYSLYGITLEERKIIED